MEINEDRNLEIRDQGIGLLRKRYAIEQRKETSEVYRNYSLGFSISSGYILISDILYTKFGVNLGISTYYNEILENNTFSNIAFIVFICSAPYAVKYYKECRLLDKLERYVINKIITFQETTKISIYIKRFKINEDIYPDVWKGGLRIDVDYPVFVMEPDDGPSEYLTISDIDRRFVP